MTEEEAKSTSPAWATIETWCKRIGLVSGAIFAMLMLADKLAPVGEIMRSYIDVLCASGVFAFSYWLRQRVQENPEELKHRRVMRLCVIGVVLAISYLALGVMMVSVKVSTRVAERDVVLQENQRVLVEAVNNINKAGGGGTAAITLKPIEELPSKRSDYSISMVAVMMTIISFYILAGTLADCVEARFQSA